MKIMYIIIALVLIIIFVSAFVYSNKKDEVTYTRPSDESAEITAFSFMQDFIKTAPPVSDEEASNRVYNSLSTSAKARVNRETLGSSLAGFVGVQDVPDQGVSVEDLQVTENTATLIVGMNYSGGRTLKAVHLVIEKGIWKVDSVSPFVKN
jgi:hypothetical protein